jgi:UDPglucose--hexose-1-phosphate uridylyltransferase
VTELRIDPLSGLRVIVAGERGRRPGAWLDVQPRTPIDPERDPFAEGHEDQTPPEVYALRDNGGPPNGPGWRVRVVPNLFPALSPDAPEPRADPLAGGRGEPDLFPSQPARGAHEVIINAPDPVHSLAEVPAEQVETAMGVWRQRMREHGGAAYVHVIVNEGKEAGASLEHSHAQLYALGFVPAQVARERERFVSYNQHTMGGDLLAEIASEEVRRKERLVAIDDDALLICPWASRSPFELRIIPRQPARSFESDGEVGVGMLRTALRAMEGRFGQVPQLNAWTLTAPRGADEFHWHLDIAPRIGIRAGFEMSTGVELNVFPPERAAAELREAL